LLSHWASINPPLRGTWGPDRTTIAKAKFPDLPYVTLEDPNVLEYATNDPRGFLEQFKTGAIINEPQKYPDLKIFLIKKHLVY